MRNIDFIATGWKMKQARIAAGYKQGEAANLLGVSAPIMSRWECGHGSPLIDNLALMLQLYGVTFEDIVAYKD